MVRAFNAALNIKNYFETKINKDLIPRQFLSFYLKHIIIYKIKYFQILQLNKSNYVIISDKKINDYPKIKISRF